MTKFIARFSNGLVITAKDLTPEDRRKRAAETELDSCRCCSATTSGDSLDSI
jgi:hypothetical protein